MIGNSESEKEKDEKTTKLHKLLFRKSDKSEKHKEIKQKKRTPPSISVRLAFYKLNVNVYDDGLPQFYFFPLFPYWLLNAIWFVRLCV